MPAAVLYSEDLLEPVSVEQPAGYDLRWTADWDRIKEARRADDDLESGKWAKKERKYADWKLVEELASGLLRDRSKDLQVALWLVEAGIKLHGFPGLRDALSVTCGLLVRYWDNGLYPLIEDGPEDRAGPFEWLNNKLVDAVASIPITVRDDGGPNYSLLTLRDARRVGYEAGCRDADGEIDSNKKRLFDTALADGHISLDMFDQAVAAGSRRQYEALYSDFRESFEAFRSLERAIDDKFGEVAPNLASIRGIFAELSQEFDAILEQKRRAEPDIADAAPAGEAPRVESGSTLTVRFPLPLVEMSNSTTAGSWEEAESLVRTGQIERGLARMTQLSAQEGCGRNRFQRKLLLADVCLNTRRDRLARSILEELAGQIDQLQLHLWESSELIANVWIRLYKLYRRTSDGGDQDRAEKLYERLCHLDPWQALKCGEE